MPKREYPAVRARLYDPGRRYVQRYDGFGRYDVVSELWRGGRVTNSLVSPAELGVGAGVGRQAEAPTAMALDQSGLNLVVCRPFLDTTQQIGLEHFDLYGGQWLQLDGLGMGSEVKLYQYDGRSSSPTGAVSRFSLPRNPVLCISLQRAEPGPEHVWAATPPCTEIQFGVGTDQEWALALPYGGHALLMKRVNGEWQQVANASRALLGKGLEGDGPGQRLLLWVAVWRGKLVLSTDGFAESVWVCPDGSEAVSVPSGRLALWHNAGQWSFSVLPVVMTTATIDSLAIEAGYDTAACAGDVILQAETQPVTDDAGTVLSTVGVADTTDDRTDLSIYQRAWRATLEPYLHTVTEPAFHTWVSPELHAVQAGQYPEIVDTGLQSWQEISGDVKRVTGQSDNDGRATVYEMSLDNALGQWAELSEYRECQLELGWVLAGGEVVYEPATVGYVAEPDPSVLAGPADRMGAVVFDPMLRLHDEKCDGRSPVFDGWPVTDVFRWVLGRCGVPEALRDLEDTGTRLSSGAFDRPLWQVEPGRSWSEFLAEVAEFDHRAAIFFGVDGLFRKACRYCRRARTAEDVAEHDGTAAGACGGDVQWELYTRAALGAPPDGERGVLSIQKARRSLHRSDFANCVAVCGTDVDGQPVRATVSDPDSLYDAGSDVFVGWRKMEVLALETYTTQAETNRLAQEILDERGKRPEHAAITIPLEPGVRIGDVVRVNGGETVGAQGRKYRVEGVRHDVSRDSDAIATTHILGRWLKQEV